MNLATEVAPWQGSPEILNETSTPAITDAQIGHAADILIKTTDASGQWGLRRPPPNQRQQTSGPSSSTDASAAAATICARSSRRRKGSRLRRSRGRSLRRALCDRQCEFVGRFVLWRRYRSLCVQEGWATGVGIVSAAATSASDRTSADIRADRRRADPCRPIALSGGSATLSKVPGSGHIDTTNRVDGCLDPGQPSQRRAVGIFGTGKSRGPEVVAPHKHRSRAGPPRCGSGMPAVLLTGRPDLGRSLFQRLRTNGEQRPGTEPRHQGNRSPARRPASAWFGTASARRCTSRCGPHRAGVENSGNACRWVGFGNSLECRGRDGDTEMRSCMDPARKDSNSRSTSAPSVPRCSSCSNCHCLARSASDVAGRRAHRNPRGPWSRHWHACSRARRSCWADSGI